MFLTIIILLLLVLLYNSKELFTQEKTKDVLMIGTVKGKIWNHLDAKTKCGASCKLLNPDKNIQFNGNWLNHEDDATCECSYKGNYKKDYVGCSLSHKNCFIWNDSEAKNECQNICNKYLPNVHSKWTGNWKNTSADTTACECEYYD